jgi:hypothetical protein
VFAVLGAYYCVLAVFLLASLPEVTRQWIERSGDPDFKYDSSLFMMLGGLGAASIGALGWRTVVKGVATARGRHATWLGPTLAAWPLHWFWFLHRIIGAGVPDRAGQIVVQRHAAIQFGSVCIGYVVLWVITRRPSSSGPPNIRLQPTAGGTIMSRRG